MNRAILLMFLFVSAIVKGQVVKGVFVDEQDSPLSGINITLQTVDQQKRIGGTSTNADGAFSILYKQSGSYLLRASCIGYQSYAMELKDVSGIVDLGRLQLLEDPVALGEVVVEAASSIQKVDCQMVFPQKQQIAASTSGYALLNQLALPGIKINEMSQSVSTLTGTGVVQLRINGIISTKADVTALNPTEVLRVEYIENPGIRYGDEVGAVINFIVKRRNNGWVGGVNLMNALTTGLGTDLVYLKYNHKRSEFALNYSLDYKSGLAENVDETVRYRFPNNTEHSIERTGLHATNTSQLHALQLSYNLNLNDKHVFNAVLSGSLLHNPVNILNQKVEETGRDSYQAITETADKFKSPSIDLYYQAVLPHKQSLTINAVGTYTTSDYDYHYIENALNKGQELSTYGYTTKGEKYAFLSEAIYEKQFAPFALSAGIQYAQSYLENTYFTERNTVNEMHNSNLYTYMQLKGKIDKLNYMLGVGMSRQYNKQDSLGYAYWSFRPSITLSYPLFKGANLNYQFSVKPNLPKLSMLSDVALQRNEWEIIVGNPNLEPFRNLINRLTFMYQHPRFTMQLVGVYMHSNDAIMPTVDRVEKDGKPLFVFSGENQKSMNQLLGQAYVQYKLIPKRLTLVGYGGVNRYFSNGNAYTRRYTSWFGGASAMVYAGNWNMRAGVDSRYNSLFGETIWYNEYSSNINVSYKFKTAQIGLGWMYPLQPKGRSNGEVLQDNLVSKRTWNTIESYGNMVTLNLTWNFNAGRKYQSVDKSLELKDTDTGIVK